MCRQWRQLLVGIVAALLFTATLCCAQDDEGGEAAQDDVERLQRERIEHLREMARQQAAGPQRYVIQLPGEGQMARIGGPPAPEMVPAQLHVVGDYVYVVRGWMLRQYLADDRLELQAAVDLRSEDELPPEGGPPAMRRGPDAAAVPVHVRFSANGDLIYVLRGYILRQFLAEGMQQMAEFDLRTEEERRRPRIQMRMGPFPERPPPDAQ
ncbi:MAG: hypothetical protein U9R79_18415 [Armatimonadota bacterium]|nr:hypothetical protein [Armatimonadota bacterium]